MGQWQVSNQTSYHSSEGCARLLTLHTVRRLILTYLIVASLPLGYFPSEELLAEFDLSEQYDNLLPALQVRQGLLVR